MKNSSILFVLCIALFCFLFTSCKGTTGDILEGTWKSDFGVSSGVFMDDMEMTYVFDGKGNYTFTSVQSGITYITKGTYKLIDDKYLHTYFITTNGEGVSQEKDEVLELDTSKKPYTLTLAVYDGNGNFLQYLMFVKQ